MESDFNLITIMEQFPDADSAREYLESKRWPNGPVCPHCKSTEAYKLQPKPTSKRPGRKGLYKCKACRKQFTVTVGTIFEDSKIGLHKWLIAIHLMCASKKGMSAHQLHRMLGVTYKSAWFMAHRIRYAMTQKPLASKLSGIVEADETYIGGKEKNKHFDKRQSGTQGRSTKTKTPVFALVQRDGEVRSFPMSQVNGANLKEVMRENIDSEARIMTDEFRAYQGLDKEYANHEVITHSEGEYVRGDVHTNTAEGYFSLLKRGIIGTYHHVGSQHLHRYTGEFDFRYNARKVKDGERASMAIQGAEGKRLKYE